MRRAILLTALYALAAALVTFVFVVRPGLAGHDRAGFPAMIDGTAHRPFVTRALAPVTVRLTARAIPDGARAWLTRRLRNRRMVYMLGWEEGYLVAYALACALFLGCFVGFAWLMRALVATFYEVAPALRDLSPLIALSWLPLLFRYYSYVYDPVTLLTYTLGVLAIARGRFLLAVIAVALAALNKETAILLVGVFVVAPGGEPRTKLAKAGVLLAVYAGARWLVYSAYRDNPGFAVENHLAHNAWLFTSLPLNIWMALLVAVPLAALVTIRWREKRVFVRRGLLVTLLPLLAGCALFGYLDELRGYYEAFPFIFMAALPTLARFLGWSCAPTGVMAD